MPFIICLSRRDFNARAKEREGNNSSNPMNGQSLHKLVSSVVIKTRNSQLVWSLCREQLTNKFHFSLTLLCQRIGATTSTIVSREIARFFNDEKQQASFDQMWICFLALTHTFLWAVELQLVQVAVLEWGP